MRIIGFIFWGVLISLNSIAQNKKQDSTWSASGNLPDITVVGRNSKDDIQRMPEIVGTSIYAGRKTSLIVVDNVAGNIVTNTMRQVMAKVPGIHIWESDPSGIQIGIATRGLSPNRSWEFNVRQNGYDIAADPFGYPEAYYNPQLQSVQRIEIVRGQGALQYGPQFGGMINYILKNGSEINKKIEVESQNTIGSNGLFNSYHAIGGKKNKIQYYTFWDHRNGNGWRNNSGYLVNAGFATLSYQLSPKLTATAEIMQSHTRSQQPGGLTDLQITQNAKQSFRARNWFDLSWTTPALIFNYQFSESSRWNTKFFATIGNRNSVGFIAPITIKDTVNSITKEYNNRTLNEDRYRNYGIETKIISSYSLWNMKNTFSGGLRLYTGTTFRKSNGKGTTGPDYNMEPVESYPQDIRFQSRNLALFTENIFRLGGKWLIIPGIRYEYLMGSAKGQYTITSAGIPVFLQNIQKSRSFLLKGIGTEYHISHATEFYANISEAYRPIQFANLQAPPSTDIVDENLKDAKGYSVDIGYRGKLNSILQFDLSLYHLQYNDRMGVITPAGASYRLITNVGNSYAKGVECYTDFNLTKAFKSTSNNDLRLFLSYSYNDARYSSNHKDANTKGKMVENSPKHIVRTGISARVKQLSITTQFSYVDQVFSDANNTVLPTINGQNGLIPSYNIADISTSYNLSKTIHLKAGINNFFNIIYFTRRSGGYPGPGALPGDGRNYFLSFGCKI